MSWVRLAIPCGVLAAAVLAEEIDIGGTKLSIPAPAGYAPLADEMQPYAEVVTNFVPPQNVQYAMFLSPEDLALAAGGGIPEPKRFFYVQTARSIVHRTATFENFRELKKAAKTENAEMAKALEEKVPGFFRRLNEQIAQKTSVDPGISMNQMVPFPPHDESDRTMAFSMLTSYEMTDEDGNPVAWEASVTATWVHVKGKVVFLYAVGERSDLEWSRTASRAWASEVVSANPSTGAIAEAELRKAKKGFDWGEVRLWAILGGIIGGVIAILGQFARKRKAR